MEKNAKAYLGEIKSEVTDFLFNLVGIRSYPHDELAACEYCYQKFSEIKGAKVEKIMIDNSLKDHPWHCPGWVGKMDYTDHYNIEITWPGSGEQKPFYMNAHIDTVFAFSESLFPPYIKDDILYGLGACDDKGSIASMYIVFRLLSEFEVKLPFDVVGHVVVEEEIGGNGALAITNRPLEGQCAVDMEPTAGCVMPSSRAAMVLDIKVRTDSRMMGENVSYKDSAFRLAHLAVKVAQAEHDKYTDNSLDVWPFEGYRTPSVMGMIEAHGDPDMVSSYAHAWLCITCLNNITTGEILGRMISAIMEVPELKNKVDLEVLFERENTIGDPEHPFVQEFSRCVQANGLSGEITPMRACSDTIFYQDVIGVPTVVFGPGRLSDAHNIAEQVPLEEVLTCGKTIFDWIIGRIGKGGPV